MVLGATGMLGHTCREILSDESRLEVIGTSRQSSSGLISFDPLKENINLLLDQVKPEWVINCIGIIKSQIDSGSSRSTENALLVNSLFPHQLASHSGFRVIQIATDCVYSGDKGSYKESDAHDALDVYGKTKSLGEVNFEHFHNLRSSIVGFEIRHFRSLLEWFRSQPQMSKIDGYTNHFWNGVTTHHFAKVARGIIFEDVITFNLAHLCPSGTISKFSLLQLFGVHFNRKDLVIRRHETQHSVDRTLSTANESLNHTLWEVGGYSYPPSIEDMIEEYASIYLPGD